MRERERRNLPVLISIIAALALASGREKVSSLSNLPGLLKAGSIASGLGLELGLGLAFGLGFGLGLGLGLCLR
jgi:hypothetical protein